MSHALATAARAARRRVRDNAFVVERMESRICLAELSFYFQAANFSDRDGFGGAEPATDNIRSVQFTQPPGYNFELSTWAYNPSGHGGGRFDWPEFKSMRVSRPDGTEAMASAFSTGGVQADLLGTTDRAATLDSFAQQQIVEQQGDNWVATGPPVAHDITWSIQGGGLNGRNVTLHGRRIEFRNDTVSTPEAVVGATMRRYLFYAGRATTGFPQFFTVTTDVATTLIASPPDIPMAQAAATLLGAGSAPAYDRQVLGTIESGLKFTGAIPDTLLLYDFSGEETLPPPAVRYVNQYEQSQLPPRYGVRSGAACGPSSLVMALDEVSTTVAVLDAFNQTMTPRTPDKADPERPGEYFQEFKWDKGEKYARSKLPASRSVVFREYDSWGNIDANLDAGSPVIISTKLAETTADGTGHVMLMLGVGRDPLVKDALGQLYGGSGDYYIVADPAGHYYGDAITGGYNQGHYGTVAGLRALAKAINYGGWFAVYPKSELVAKVQGRPGDPAVIRTLTIRPVQPVVKVGAHSPVSVVITDPLGRRSGIRPDGSILDEIPGGDYQVAVSEEFGGGVTYDPEEEKAVVITRPVHGTYQVQLVGTGNGSYTLDIDLLQPGAALVTTTHAGTIVPGEVKNYSFAFPPGNSPAPRVTDVYVRGSAWTPAFRTALAAVSLGDASAGYKVPFGGAAQLATVPWTNINQVVVRFDREVEVDAADVAVRGVRRNYIAGAVAPLAGMSNAFVFTLDAPLGADKLLLDVNGDAGGVTAAAGGLPLDGDGDNTPGGDFRFRFNALPGDIDRSGSVLANDFSAVKQNFFATPSSPLYSVAQDVNGSGAILADDFSEVKRRFFHTLPPGEPPVAATALRIRPATALVRREEW